MPLRLLVTLGALLYTAGPLGAQSPAGRQVLQAGGLQRSYLLHLPASPAADSLAVLLVFHGAGGDAAGIAEHTGLTAAATARGYAVIYPEGVGRRWSDGRAARAGADDVGFVRLLLDSLARSLPVDPRRVFATGISNGAGLVLRLACDLPGTFAAIAPVAGALPGELEERCASATPVSVLMFQGTRDRLMPYGGGALSLARGRVLPAPATAELFAGAGGCSAEPTLTAEPDTVADGTRTRRSTWSGCRDGREIVLLTIEGGGHTWPGGPPVGRSVGRVARDIHATSLMLDFFDRHPRP
jgi:polyhydroxybutyrate depolymerase